MLVQDVLDAAGFRTNPFRIVPPADMDNILWAGDKNRIEELYDAARSPRSDNLGTSELVVLFGEYGSGKTNALKWLYKHLSADRELVAYVVKPSVADKPSWHDIVRTLFTRSFQKADLIERLRPLRRWVLTEANRRATSELGVGADPDQLSGATRKSAEEVHRLITRDLPGFAQFALEMCDPRKPTVADRNWSYLSDKVIAKEGAAIAKEYGLPPEGMSSDYGATLLLSSLVRVVTFQSNSEVDFAPGARVVCLLLDEIEGLLYLPPASRLSIEQGLRDLFNACTEHLFIAIAATASDASEMWGILETALMQRLSRFPVQFPPMEPTEARSFVVEVMQLSRKGDYQGTTVWPFTDDGLDAFVQMCPAPLTPRKLLLSAQRLLFQKQKEKVLTGQGVDSEDVRAFTQWAA